MSKYFHTSLRFISAADLECRCTTAAGTTAHTLEMCPLSRRQIRQDSLPVVIDTTTGGYIRSGDMSIISMAAFHHTKIKAADTIS
jgi:hypothetical protein